MGQEKEKIIQENLRLKKIIKEILELLESYKEIEH